MAGLTDRPTNRPTEETHKTCGKLTYKPYCKAGRA